jgi:hypothetical protein
MKKPNQQEDKIKRAIRDIVTIDPLISITKLQDALFDKKFKTAQNTPLDWHYVSKLRNKIHRQSVEAVSQQTAVTRIAEFKERYRLVFERLLRIAFYSDELKKEGMQPPSYRDQIVALNSIIKMDLSIFNAELDAGIFERHLGTLEIEKRAQPLPIELKEAMMKAFRNWGLIPTENTYEPIIIDKQKEERDVVEQ